MVAALALLIFVSLVLAGYASATMLAARWDARQTIDRRIATMTGSADGAIPVGVLKDRRLLTTGVVDRLLSRLRGMTWLTRTIIHAGLKKRLDEVLFYVPLAACMAFLLVTVATRQVLLGVLAGVIGLAVPLLGVRRVARKRADAFAEQLPDALDLVRAAMQAGHGLMAALAVVAEEFPDPVAQEFRDVTEEVRLGLPLREALEHLTESSGNADIELLQVGVLVAQEVGGNLAEVLEKTSHTIRERFKAHREIAVLTAQGKLSGKVLTALPVLAGIGMTIFNPDYFGPMLQTQSGRYTLGYGVLSLLVGHFVIRRIVRLDA